MKFLKNQKGFTLVEILVVIAIIAILFITLLPQIDRATDRARQAGVKTDFRSFQLASETYLRETAGDVVTQAGYDSFLDVGLQTKADANGTTGEVGLDSTEPDPWGKEYDVHIYPTNKMIVVRSWGANETLDTPGNDDFLVASYYIDGTVASCTLGFSSNEIVSTVLTEAADANWDCGEVLADASTPTGAITLP